MSQPNLRRIFGAKPTTTAVAPVAAVPMASTGARKTPDELNVAVVAHESKDDVTLSRQKAALETRVMDLQVHCGDVIANATNAPRVPIPAWAVARLFLTMMGPLLCLYSAS